VKGDTLLTVDGTEARVDDVGVASGRPMELNTESTRLCAAGIIVADSACTVQGEVEDRADPTQASAPGEEQPNLSARKVDSFSRARGSQGKDIFIDCRSHKSILQLTHI